MKINFLFFNRNSKVLGMSLETHTMPCGLKNVSRVVIVNEEGKRVLDTYIKPQMDDLVVKSGSKS